MTQISQGISAAMRQKDAAQWWFISEWVSKLQCNSNSESCEFGEIPTSDFYDTVFTIWFSTYSRRYFDLWPFDLNIWSVHLCPQLHLTCKVCEIPVSGL